MCNLCEQGANTNTNISSVVHITNLQAWCRACTVHNLYERAHDLASCHLQPLWFSSCQLLVFGLYCPKSFSGGGLYLNGSCCTQSFSGGGLWLRGILSICPRRKGRFQVILSQSNSLVFNRCTCCKLSLSSILSLHTGTNRPWPTVKQEFRIFQHHLCSYKWHKTNKISLKFVPVPNFWFYIQMMLKRGGT